LRARGSIHPRARALAVARELLLLAAFVVKRFVCASRIAMRQHDASVTHLRWLCNPHWARNTKVLLGGFVCFVVGFQPLGMGQALMLDV